FHSTDFYWRLHHEAVIRLSVVLVCRCNTDPGAPRMGGGRAGDSPGKFWPYARASFARSTCHHLRRSEDAGAGACRLRECPGHATPEGSKRLSCTGARRPDQYFSVSDLDFCSKGESGTPINIVCPEGVVWTHPPTRPRTARNSVSNEATV